MKPTPDDKPAVPMSAPRKLMATALVMAATILVVLDQTIANIAIPHMQAALGATPDTVSWVLTSYILATAVGTPLTGWLAGRFGRSRLFAAAIAGFTISSALCGLSVSLPMMVAARIAQGLFGAFLMPLSQSIMYDMNAPSQQPRAIAIWSAGVMVGPVIAPVIGGWLTETYDWRWVFFINVPIGIVAAVGIFFFLPRFPDVRRGFDLTGFLVIAIALCGLQLALDRGTQQDWFNSTEILVELGVSAAAAWILIFHLPRARNPIVAVSLFRNVNFMAAMTLAFFVIATITASVALMPSMLQTLLGFPVKAAGEVLIPRGIALGAAMLLGARLMKVVDGRILIVIGLLLLIWSLDLHTRFDLGMDSRLVIWAGILQGLGTGLTMGTVNYAALSSVPLALRTDGAAIYGLFRSVGTALMIAIATALIARNLQVNHAELGEALQSGNMSFLMVQMAGGERAAHMAAVIADMEINRQALMIAYLDDFWLMKWTIILLLPLVLLLKPMKTPKGEAVPASE